MENHSLGILLLYISSIVKQQIHCSQKYKQMRVICVKKEKKSIKGFVLLTDEVPDTIYKEWM